MTPVSSRYHKLPQCQLLKAGAVSQGVFPQLPPCQCRCTTRPLTLYRSTLADVSAWTENISTSAFHLHSVNTQCKWNTDLFTCTRLQRCTNRTDVLQGLLLLSCTVASLHRGWFVCFGLVAFGMKCSLSLTLPLCLSPSSPCS